MSNGVFRVFLSWKISWVLLLVLIAACSSKSIKQDSFSGFLDDYSRLQSVESPEHVSTLRWVSPRFQNTKFTEVYLNGPVLFPASVQNEQNYDLIQEVLSYLHTAIESQAKAHKLPLVNQPGPGSARVDVAITAVNTANKELEVLDYIPIRLIIAGVSTAVAERDQTTELAFEIKISKGMSGPPIAESVVLGFGEDLGSASEKLQLENFKGLLDFWALRLVSGLEPYLK